MDFNCRLCNGTGWRIVTTQGHPMPDGSYVYACTTWVQCECCIQVIESTLVPASEEKRA